LCPAGRRRSGYATFEEVPHGVVGHEADVWKAPIAHLADDLGLARKTSRKYACRAEADEGRGDDLASGEQEGIRNLLAENFELRRTKEILESASLFSRPGSTDRPK
jgi:transposase-like protein